MAALRRALLFVFLPVALASGADAAVAITDASFDLETARDGMTLRLEATFDADAETVGFWSARLICPNGGSAPDVDHDTTLTLSAGASQHARDFFINAPPGEEDGGTCALALEFNPSGAADPVTHTFTDALTLQAPKPVRVTIPMYHHVLPEPADAITVTTDQFREQMAFFKAYGYETITFEELVAFRAGLAEPPRKALMLTADDGYESWLTYVEPILADPAFDGTMVGFVQTGPTRNVAPAYEIIEPYLSWPQVKALHEKGVVEIGTHSVTHPHFPEIDATQALWELSESRRMVEERVPGKRVRFFAFPYGENTERDWTLAREAGYFATATDRGGVEADSLNKWALRRIGVYADATAVFNPAAPWTFLPVLFQDEDVAVPLLSVLALESVDAATSVPLSGGRVAPGRSATVRLRAQNAWPDAPVRVTLRLDDDGDPSNGWVFDSSATTPAKDAEGVMAWGESAFHWTWNVPADLALGPLSAEVVFQDPRGVLTFLTWSADGALNAAPRRATHWSFY